MYSTHISTTLIREVRTDGSSRRGNRPRLRGGGGIGRRLQLSVRGFTLSDRGRPRGLEVAGRGFGLRDFYFRDIFCADFVGKDVSCDRVRDGYGGGSLVTSSPVVRTANFFAIRSTFQLSKGLAKG